MKDEIAVASQEVLDLRQALLVRDKQILQMRKQNMDLKQKLRCYRRMIAENQPREFVDSDGDEAQNYTLNKDFYDNLESMSQKVMTDRAS